MKKSWFWMLIFITMASCNTDEPTRSNMSSSWSPIGKFYYVELPAIAEKYGQEYISEVIFFESADTLLQYYVNSFDNITIPDNACTDAPFDWYNHKCIYILDYPTVKYDFADNTNIRYCYSLMFSDTTTLIDMDSDESGRIVFSLFSGNN